MIGRPFSPALLGSAGKVSFFVTLLLAQLMVLVKPEIVDLGVNMIIDASSDEVHFVRGYLKAPASIDLSHVRFITSEDIMFGLEDEDMDLELETETETETQTSEPTEMEVTTENKDSVNDEDNTDGEEIQDNVESETSTEQEEEPTDVVTPPEPEDNESGQVDNEDADSENIPEAPEPAGEGNEEEEQAIETPTEEKKEDKSPEETALKSKSNSNEDGGDVVQEDTTNVQEDQSEQQPETTQTEVEDEVTEEVPADTEGQKDEPEEEATPATPSDEGSDAGNAENDTESQEEQPEEDTTPAAPSDTEDTVNDEDEESTPVPPAEDNGGGRSLATAVTDQIFEILVFLAPPDCKRDRDGTCDWVSLGVGAYDDEMVGEMSYCCSQDGADRNICSASDVGTMMIDHSIFDGDHRQIRVPSDPLTDFEMADPLFQIEKSGDYVMVLANCNDGGLGIITLGEMEWKSKGGYLPGDQYEFMLFLCACSGIYLVVAIWYFCGMRSYQDAAIPIQKFILATIILGFLMHVLKSVDFVLWNQTGLRSEVLMYVAIGFGILFQGSLRILGVMVAMGWGVVRDSLGMAYCKIVFMGLLYSGVALLHECFDAISMSSGLISSNASDELFDLALVLVPVISVINVIFYVWIIRSLKITTEYLKNMNQTSKLRRHLRLRCLIITSLIIIAALTLVNLAERVAILNVVLSPDNVVLEPFLSTDMIWILRAVGLGNYLFIIIGVAFLWRPTSDAKDYAMQMQIPTNGDDENDLELSCVVPSADDIDDGEGYKIESAIAT